MIVNAYAFIPYTTNKNDPEGVSSVIAILYTCDSQSQSFVYVYDALERKSLGTVKLPSLGCWMFTIGTKAPNDTILVLMRNDVLGITLRQIATQKLEVCSSDVVQTMSMLNTSV